MGDYTTSGAPLGVGYDSNGDAKALVELNSITGLSGVSATTISATNYLGIPGGNLPTGNVGDIIYVQAAPDTYVSISPTASPLNLATTGYVAGELIPYETTANAAATYLTQSNAAATYLTQTNAAATYAQTGAGSFLNATATNLVVTNLTATNYQGPGGGGGGLPTGSTGQIVYYAAGGTTVTPLSPTATPLNLATTGYVQGELADYATIADLNAYAFTGTANLFQGKQTIANSLVSFNAVTLEPNGSVFFGDLTGAHFVHDTDAAGGLDDSFLIKKDATTAFVAIDPISETFDVGTTSKTNIAGGDVTAVNLVVTNLTATNYHNTPGIADPGGNNGDVLYYDGANWTNQNPTATPLYLATTGYVGDELQAYVNYDATTTLLEPYFQTTAIAAYPTKSEVTGPGGYLEPYATQSQVTGPGGYLEPYATTALYTTTALLSDTSSNLLEKPTTGGSNDLILYNNNNQTTTKAQSQFISDNGLVDTTQLNAYALTGAGNFLNLTSVSISVDTISATTYRNLNVTGGGTIPTGGLNEILYYQTAGDQVEPISPTAAPLNLATTGYVDTQLADYVNYNATTTLLDPYATQSQVTGPGGYLEPYATTAFTEDTYLTTATAEADYARLAQANTFTQVNSFEGGFNATGPTVFTGTASFTEKPTVNGTEVTVATDLTIYAQATALDSYALVTALDSYALVTALDSYALVTALDSYALATALDSYALVTALDSYALVTALDSYALTTALQSYLLTSVAESTYATKTQLGAYATTGSTNTFQAINSFEAGFNVTGPATFTGTTEFKDTPTVNGTDVVITTDLNSYAQATALDNYVLTGIGNVLDLTAVTISVGTISATTYRNLNVTGGGTIPEGQAGQILYYETGGSDVDPISPTATPLNLATTGYVDTQLADYVNYNATTTLLDPYATKSDVTGPGGYLEPYATTAFTEDTYLTTATAETDYARLAQANTFTQTNSFQGGFNATGPLVFTGTASFTEKPTVNGTEITVATDLTAYAQATALDSYALVTALDSYALVTALDSYALVTALDSYALVTALDSYALVTALDSYALVTALDSYALVTALDSYALVTALDSYATTASLDAYALTASPNTFTALNSFEGGFNVTGPTTFTGTSEFKTLPTVNGGNVATESYVQTELADYALVTALDSYALVTALDSYALVTALDSYALVTALDSYALVTALDSYALVTALDSYALVTALDSYALTTALDSYLLTSVADSTYATTGGGNTFEGTQVFKSVSAHSLLVTNGASALASVSGPSGTMLYFSGGQGDSGLETHPVATFVQLENLHDTDTSAFNDDPEILDRKILLYNGKGNPQNGWTPLGLIEFLQKTGLVGGTPQPWPGEATDAPSLNFKFDHGSNLSGLGDDDHTQYVLSDGTRPITYLSATEGISGAIVSATDVSTVNLNGTPIDMSFTESGQILKYDGTTLQADYSDQSFIRVYNDTGIDLGKGTAVYVSGALNANVFKVAPAKADAASSMPAIGLVYEDILNEGEGQVVSFGKAGGLNTASYAVGDTVYVSPTTAGGLTNVKPSGVDEFIQNVGIVSFVNATTGVIKVTGVGRANDVPNKVDAVSGNFDDLCINRVGQGRPTKFRWENDYLTPGATQAGWGSHTNNGTAGAGAGIGGHFSNMIDTVDYGVGVLEIRSGTGTSGRAMLTTFNNVFVPSSMGFNLSHRLTMQDLYSAGTNEGYVIVGIADNGGNATKPTRGLYFRYDHTSTDWQAIATTAFSTETVSGTGVAVKEEEFQVLQIIVDEDWTKAQYFVDGSLVATMTLADGHEIPQTGQMGLQVKVVNTNGGAGNDIWLDWHVYELSVDKVDRGEDYIKAGFV